MGADETRNALVNVGRHAAHDRPRQRARRRHVPPHVLDRGRRALRRGHVQRGHVRRGPEAGPPVPPHEVRVREARARARQGAVARLPAVAGDRRLADRRDGQDRRPVLLLQAHPEGPAHAAGVVPADLAGVGLDEHRPGRLRRRDRRPHRPQGRPRRPGLPRRGPQGPARRRGPEHVRGGRPRAQGRDADRPPRDPEPAQGRAQLRAQAAGAQADPRERAGRPRDPGRGRRLHRALVPLRRPRHPARAARHRHRDPAAADVRDEDLGLLGAHARSRSLQGPLLRGRGQRQDGRDHGRVERHRPRGGAEDRRRGRHPDPRRAHQGEARRGQGRDRGRGRHRVRRALRPQRLRRDRRSSSRRCWPTTRASTCSSTTRDARSGAP